MQNSKCLFSLKHPTYEILLLKDLITQNTETFQDYL